MVVVGTKKKQKDSQEKGREKMKRFVMDRVYGMFLGGGCGDAIGSCFEFKGKRYIEETATDAFFKRIHGSETFRTIPGQVTDDTEMAISLMNALLEGKGYKRDVVIKHYRKWLFDTTPFDCGNTIMNALYGKERGTASESNGALMRCFPLSLVLGKNPSYNDFEMVIDEAQITHLNRFVVDCNLVFLFTLSYAITSNSGATEVYEYARNFVKTYKDIIDQKVQDIVLKNEKPDTYTRQIGWCRIAFENAFWHLTHTSTPKEAIVATVREGGDTDTNAAICGALMGAVYGEKSFPQNWRDAVRDCKPDHTTRQPRPKFLWFNNYNERADKLASMFD